MARKTKTVTIDAENRDKGKIFIITEMPAAQAETWAMRAFLALARSGVEIPQDIASAGLAGIASMGLKALGALDWEVAGPLIAEMMDCVKILSPDGKVERKPLPDEIEEITTRLLLRKEVLALHLDFFSIADLSALKN